MHLLKTNSGYLDLLETVGDDLRYNDLLDRTEEYEIEESLRVRALDLMTLIETKEHAGQPKDHHALLFLRQAIEMRRQDP